MAIQIRRGTSAEWESNNSNIVAGEPAIATDAERFFVGTASGDYAEFVNLDIIAPAYDTSTSYVVGDVINRQGKLYSCNTPCSGSFNIGYWNETSLTEILKDLENEITYAQYEIGYASGELITIDNGASEIPVKDLTVDIEAVQSGSGDPSPTNIRPISGWDEVNVNVRDVNIWDEEWEQGTFNNDTGMPVASTANIRSKNFIPILPNTQYYSRTGDNSWLTRLFYDSAQNFITYQRTKNGVFTTPNNACYMKFRTEGGRYGNTYHNDISINYPSTDHDYHAYNGQTYTIDLNGTRYGGTLDVTTGVLTVTHGSVDMGTLDWTKNSSYNLMQVQLQNAEQGVSGIAPSLLCDRYTTDVSGSNADINAHADKTITLRNASNVVIVKDSAYTDAASFKTAMSGAQLVYKLATPQTVQLTPTQARTVLGTNNLWNQMNSNNELAYRISNALN